MLDSTLINALSTMGIGYLLVFGSLLVWPAMKFGSRFPPERLCVLKWLFLQQVFWLLVSLLVIHYYHNADMRDWLRGFVYPYVVGAVSWLTVLAALLSLGFQLKKKTR
jgi:hypothetical protein